MSLLSCWRIPYRSGSVEVCPRGALEVMSSPVCFGCVVGCPPGNPHGVPLGIPQGIRQAILHGDSPGDLPWHIRRVLGDPARNPHGDPLRDSLGDPFGGFTPP